MLKEFRYPIKVNSKIRTISRKERTEPELKLGSKYFVSFGTNYAYPCFLTAIINEFEQTEVKIKVQIKENISYFRKDGQLAYYPFQEHLLYANEIGNTPEDAVRNSV